MVQKDKRQAGELYVARADQMRVQTNAKHMEEFGLRNSRPDVVEAARSMSRHAISKRQKIEQEIVIVREG